MKLQVTLEILLSMTIAMMLALYALLCYHAMSQAAIDYQPSTENSICNAINSAANAATHSCNYCVYTMQIRC